LPKGYNMQRIQLGAPYEEFIKKMISSGYYNTSTEVIRDALRGKMPEMEENRIEQIRALVAEGQKSLNKGDVIEVGDNSFNEALKRAKENLADGKEIPNHLLP